MMNETENQTRLRRAKESLLACRTAEADARKSLALAVESTRRMREKYEQLFLEEQEAERARLLKSYQYSTK